MIGHLKQDFRLSRNYLKGANGDVANVLLAATTYNLKKWMNTEYIKISLFIYSKISALLEFIDNQKYILINKRAFLETTN